MASSLCDRSDDRVSNDFENTVSASQLGASLPDEQNDNSQIDEPLEE
jgi:hypothetical protein